MRHRPWFIPCCRLNPEHCVPQASTLLTERHLQPTVAFPLSLSTTTVCQIPDRGPRLQLSVCTLRGWQVSKVTCEM